MIVADTNIWIAYFEGQRGSDVDAMDRSLQDGILRMCPVVLTELFSDPALDTDLVEALMAVPLLELIAGVWERTGRLRAAAISNKLKPKLADSLIAQICIDHEAVLITRDKGFQGFVSAGLRLF